MKDIKVSKVIIEIGGEEKTLTLDQARALKDALNDLFSRETVRVDCYRYIRYEPVPGVYRPWEPWITYTTCGSDTARFQVNY